MPAESSEGFSHSVLLYALDRHPVYHVSRKSSRPEIQIEIETYNTSKGRP